MMKEFEKWWYKHRDGALENFELDKKHSSSAWRAALELVLDMFGANTFHGCPPINIEKAIKEELGDI